MVSLYRRAKQWEATAELRWLIRGEAKILQQRWVANTGEQAWRDVPIEVPDA